MQHFLVALVGLVPASRVKNSLLRRLGWTIGAASSVGPGVYWKIDRAILGENTRIGPLNVFRDLAELRLGDRARVGQWNWVSASSILRSAGSPGTLEIGQDSALTARHYLDTSGGIRVGHHTTIAGVRSTFITHGIDWKKSRQRTKGISVGDYCIVSSNVAFTPGTVVADRVVVGMGSVLAGQVGPPGTLVTTARADVVKTNLHGDYFERAVGYVAQIERTHVA